MTENIDSIFNLLSCYSDEKSQKSGIDIAGHIKHLSVLIMPIGDKSVWENCAKVLASKKDKELEPFLYNLFEWLKDMNWPGADIIYNRLMDISLDSLMYAFRHSLLVSKQTLDHPWEMALNDFYSEYSLKLKKKHR